MINRKDLVDIVCTEAMESGGGPEAPLLPKMSIDETLEAITAAEACVHALCSGEKKWTMRVPVHPGDTDVIIATALDEAEKTIRTLREDKERWKEFAEALDGMCVLYRTNALRQASRSTGKVVDRARAARAAIDAAAKETK